MAETGTGTGEGILSVKVVTPEGAVYDGDATFVAIPAKQGEMGVLAQHTPVIAQLGIGPLRVEGGEKNAVFAVRGGFVQIHEDTVVLLATEAVLPEDIDLEALKAELATLLEKLQHPESDEHYQELQDDRHWIETRQKVAG